MFTKSTLPLLRVVGQVSNTYIVAEGPDGMYLVDQHAAHERRFSKECSRNGRRNGCRYRGCWLLLPLTFHLCKEKV